MRIEKTGAGPKELELSGGQAGEAVFGEIVNHGLFAGHDGFEIEACLWNSESPRPARTRQVEHFGRVEERLAGHAPAQDAQSAHFRPALDHDGFESGRGRCARRRVTRAAPAQDGKIEIPRTPL